MKDYDLYHRLFHDSYDPEEEPYFSYGGYESETLVIHPDDPTTDFLSAIYENKGWDVLTDPFANDDTVTELIKSHRRIICLGHGTQDGMYNLDRLIINTNHAHLLKEKETICIWCNSDIYVKEHGLIPSLFTGMFISEKFESEIYDIQTDELSIELSNDIFSHAVGKYINSENVLERVKREYNDPDDPIVTFNRDRLYSNLQEVNNAEQSSY